jgi:site-specific recombinase XerD
MSDVRQMPLFPSRPESPDDLNKHTLLKDTLPLFIQHLLREGKSEHTIKAFTADLDLLMKYTGSDRPVGQYTTTALNQFLNWLEHGRGVPCSRKSYARRVTTLKVFFKWLLIIGAISHDPAKPVLQRSGPAPLSEVLSPHEVERILDFARSQKRGDEVDFRPELVFRLLRDTGIKKGETMLLLPEHIDRTNPRHPTLLVRYKVRNVYKERRIDLDPDWVKLLDLYLQQYEPKDTIFNCTSRNLEYILTDLGKGAGVKAKLSFEMLRWTCGVRDYRTGINEELIREKLGLSDTSWHETSAKIKRLAHMQQSQEG